MWRNVVHAWGLEVARRYGLSGKVLISLLAGQMFAFFFTGIKSLYLYIACLNWIEDPELLDRFPSVVSVIMLLVALLTVGLVVLTYRYATAVLPNRAAHPAVAPSG